MPRTNEQKKLHPDEVIRAAHAVFLSGEKQLKDLEAELGYKPGGLVAAFRRLDLPPKYPRKLGLQDARVKEAIAAWDAGGGVVKTARRFGMGSATLSRLLRESGRNPQPIGPRHHSWRGGRSRQSIGYVRITLSPEDPYYCMCRSGGGVLEHRLVMARHLGRPLTSKETVHHKNGIRDDNRLENLQLRRGQHGQGARFRCCECGSENVEPTAV